jgi:hypothetical protein
MTPSDGQPDRLTSHSELSFSALEEQDVLVQAFRDFVNSELSKRGHNHLDEVVAEFSRRLSFLMKYVGVDLRSDNLASKILELNDAKMAELVLDAVNSTVGRDRLARYLQVQPYPHYEVHPTNHDLVVRIEEDGSRVLGHFVDKEFVAVNNDQ